jgi:hypothetical protein
VPAGHVLDDRLPGFIHLTEEEKKELRWSSIFGTQAGYSVTFWGRQDVELRVSSKNTSSNPAGHENDVHLGEENTFTLSGGTKIIPLEDTSK